MGEARSAEVQLPASALRTGRERAADTSHQALPAGQGVVGLELSVLLFVKGDEPGFVDGLARTERVLAKIEPRHEIVVVDLGVGAAARAAIERHGVRLLGPFADYASGFWAGVDGTSGRYLATLDGRLSRDPYFLINLWAARHQAELVVASRFVPGGIFQASLPYRVASRGLNRWIAAVLSLEYRDLTSALRLYRRSVLAEARPWSSARSYDLLPELVVLVHGLGWRVLEVPYCSSVHSVGRGVASGAEVAGPCLAGLWRMWKLRNSVFSADYDDRAFNSRIWPQRWWQRRRFRLIVGFVETPEDLLDVGCGSSKIIQAYPGAVGIDIQLKKLRFLHKRNMFLAVGSAYRLPVTSERFKTVICSEVIEHIPYSEELFAELARVLRPGGVLILGTPDYGRPWWPAIEWVYSKVHPKGYVGEHITHYTHRKIVTLLERQGLVVEQERYICRAELVIKARKVKKGISPISVA